MIIGQADGVDLPAGQPDGHVHQNGFSMSSQTPWCRRASDKNFIGEGYSRLAPAMRSGSGKL